MRDAAAAGSPVQFRRIGMRDTAVLGAFLASAGESLKTFRYFARRPLSVIQNHLCTWVIEEREGVHAYGHLDREEGVVWLGIAVAARARRRGYGKAMMRRLMESAAALGIQRVRLAVDRDNEVARRLYEGFGFAVDQDGGADGALFYEWVSPSTKAVVVSSMAFAGSSAEEMIATAQKEGLALEFSSGMAYRPDMAEVFMVAPVARLAHNYFPAPREAFVLNLGSADEAIRRRSIAHCVQGLRLSYAVGAPFFSAHAAFCVDPEPAELGRRLRGKGPFEAAAHWGRFVESIREVLALSGDLPTGFLIENHVLAEMNVDVDGSHPLLGVRAEEMLRLVDDVGNPRLGLLLDTGHLKVSARTLGFDAVAEARELLPLTRCIHHSDNDGRRDSNHPIGDAYWFLPLMDKALHAVHVLEVQPQPAAALTAQGERLFH